MKTNLEKIQQRALQYWYEDGLTELSFGAICLILGLYFFAQVVLPEDSTLSNFLDAAFVLVLLGGVLLVNRLQGFLKSRITYPRTGYVEYKQPGGKYRWVGRLLAGLIALLVAGLMAATPESLAWMPAVTGLLLAGILVYLGLRIGLLRFYALSLVSLATGVGLALSGLGDILGLAYYYFLMWLALSVSGGITLAAYLKRTGEAG